MTAGQLWKALAPTRPTTPTTVARAIWLVVVTVAGACGALGAVFGAALSLALDDGPLELKVPWKGSGPDGDIELHVDGTGQVSAFPTRPEPAVCANAATPYTGDVAWYQDERGRLYLQIEGRDYEWAPDYFYGWSWDEVNVWVCDVGDGHFSNIWYGGSPTSP